jgi:alpha-galactosidase
MEREPLRTGTVAHPITRHLGTTVHHLSSGGVSVVIDASGGALPAIVYWGAALGNIDTPMLAELGAGAYRPQTSDSVDIGLRLSVLPEESAGWLGRPGLVGHRDGTASTHEFVVEEHTVSDSSATYTARSDTGLEVCLEIDLTQQGLLRQRAQVTNVGSSRFQLDAVNLTAPVSPRAVEILDFAGGHMRERMPQRAAWDCGERCHVSRRGRPGLQSATLIAAGEHGFSFASGEVWSVHVSWSGNQLLYAEHTTDGEKLIGGGEHLMPGEIALAPQQSYCGPWVYFAWGSGLDDLSRRFHGWVRSRPRRATRVRPVTLNSWEAVYFDHDLEHLRALARVASSVGVERFVLDDGWFGSRRDDRSGLGDWTVSTHAWPRGLNPLIETVTDAGLEFGLWVEPEMISEDSDLYRAHPEWTLGSPGRLPLAQRYQHVLDLTRPEAYAHIRDALVALVTHHDISYLKWDHNRDLLEAVDSVTGAARAHDQTEAFYHLLDEVSGARHGLEIESCASGGGRIDLGVLDHTDRVWTSDSIDPAERQRLLRWTGLIVPPELMGSHIGDATAHDTGRTHHLDFRAITALFGHFGLEMDLTRLDPHELDRVATWIAYSKSVRRLIASGTTIRVDDPDPSRYVHGIVSSDRREAVFAIAAVSKSAYQPALPAVLRGLDRDAEYMVRIAEPMATTTPDHPLTQGLRLTGRLLEEAGVRPPYLRPGEATLLEVNAH